MPTVCPRSKALGNSVEEVLTFGKSRPKIGPVAPRKTKGTCTECMKEDWTTDNERRKTLPKSEASKAAGKRYYEKNKELVKAKAASRPKDFKKLRLFMNWVVYGAIIGFDNLINKLLLQK